MGRAATFLALVCVPFAAGAAVNTYDDRFVFLDAAGFLHLEDFEAADLVGEPGSDGVYMLAFHGFRAEAPIPSLKLVDYEGAGVHGMSTYGPQYLAADTGSLLLSTELTLRFDPPIDRLGFFIVDLDSFAMGVTVNGVTHVIPPTGNGLDGYFGIVSDVDFSEVVLYSLGSENHYSLDDLSFPEPPPGLAAGGVPDGGFLRPGPLLSLSHAAAGDLSLSWGNSCNFDDTDFEIYEGVLGDFASHLPLICSTGGSTGAVVTPAPGNAYYLVVARNQMREGSYGRSSDGQERPRPSSACMLQETPRCE